MDDILQNMDIEKRDRLINSALKEFASNTYDKASTNNIVKNAGISKGLLYHYFDSKESLYNYLIRFLYKKTANELIANIDLEEQDLLKRISMTVKYKMALIRKYPNIMDFAKNFYVGKTMEEMKELVDKFTPNFYHDYYHKNIDYSLFKEGVDIQRVLNMTQWTVEKFSETYTTSFFEGEGSDLEGVFEELGRYMDMIREAFYK